MSTQERKTKEKEHRREMILDAALSIMQDQGLHKLNIDQVAKSTDLAKGTIYLYFKSKEEILASLTIRARKLLYKDFLKVARKKVDPIEKIKGFVKANFAFARKHPLYFSLFSLYEVESQVSETEEMYQSSQDIVELVTSIVEEAREAGMLRGDMDPEQFTMVLYGATVGVSQLVKVRGKIMSERMEITENQLVDTFLKVVEGGVRK